MATSLLILLLLITAVSPALASPDEDLANLIAAVEALVADGELGHGNGNALIAKLEAAQQSLADGQLNAAANQLAGHVANVDAAARVTAGCRHQQRHVKSSRQQQHKECPVKQIGAPIRARRARDHTDRWRACARTPAR